MQQNIQNLIKILIKHSSFEVEQFLIKCALMDNHHLSIALLRKVFINDDKLATNFYDLVNIRFNLSKGSSGTDQLFYMHDIIKENIMEITNEEKVKQNLLELIKSINSLFPEDFPSIEKVIKENPALRDNMEAILRNSEKYHLP